MPTHEQKIKKAKGATLAHLNKPVIETDQPNRLNLELSDVSKDLLENLTVSMKEAQEKVPDSEKVENFEDESKILDSMFEDMAIKPSLSIASVGRRKEIESRLKSLKIEELFVGGELRQEVPIRPGRMVVVYKTLRGKEDLYIKRRLNEVRNDVARYAEDKYLFMLLSAHMYSYNGKMLPSIIDENGLIDNTSFDKRFNEVSDIPYILIEELWVNFRWFEDRVRQALETDSLKDG